MYIQANLKSSKTDNVLNNNRSLLICDGKVKKFKIFRFIFVSSSPFHEKCMLIYEGLRIIISRSMNEFFSAAELIFSCWSNWLQKQPPEVFYKKVVLKNFSKFKGKQLWQSHFLNKVEDRSLKIYWKGDSGTGASLQMLRIFSQNTFGWLLLWLINPFFQMLPFNSPENIKRDIGRVDLNGRKGNFGREHRLIISCLIKSFGFLMFSGGSITRGHLEEMNWFMKWNKILPWLL